MGFLGGVNFALLAAYVCQLFPRYSPAALLHRFFFIFSSWQWPNPVKLTRPYTLPLGFPVWDPEHNIRDRKDVMPIITPAYPCSNSSYNVSRSTLGVMMGEVARGLEIVDSLLRGSDAVTTHDWGRLFAQSDFFTRFDSYLVLDVGAEKESDVPAWKGFVESRVRKLVEALEFERLPLSVIYPFPKAFSREPMQQEQLPVQQATSTSQDLQLRIQGLHGPRTEVVVATGMSTPAYEATATIADAAVHDSAVNAGGVVFGALEPASTLPSMLVAHKGASQITINPPGVPRTSNYSFTDDDTIAEMASTSTPTSTSASAGSDLGGSDGAKPTSDIALVQEDVTLALTATAEDETSAVSADLVPGDATTTTPVVKHESNSRAKENDGRLSVFSGKRLCSGDNEPSRDAAQSTIIPGVELAERELGGAIVVQRGNEMNVLNAPLGMRPSTGSGSSAPTINTPTVYTYYIGIQPDKERIAANTTLNLTPVLKTFKAMALMNWVGRREGMSVRQRVLGWKELPDSVFGGLTERIAAVAVRRSLREAARATAARDLADATALAVAPRTNVWLRAATTVGNTATPVSALLQQQQQQQPYQGRDVTMVHSSRGSASTVSGGSGAAVQPSPIPGLTAASPMEPIERRSVLPPSSGLVSSSFVTPLVHIVPVRPSAVPPPAALRARHAVRPLLRAPASIQSHGTHATISATVLPAAMPQAIPFSHAVSHRLIGTTSSSAAVASEHLQFPRPLLPSHSIGRPSHVLLVEPHSSADGARNAVYSSGGGNVGEPAQATSMTVDQLQPMANFHSAADISSERSTVTTTARPPQRFLAAKRMRVALL